MNPLEHNSDDRDIEQAITSQRQRKPFKKLKRPVHTSKRTTVPERMRGMHRRRRKQIDW